MKETIKGIAGGIGCCLGWALIIWAGVAWWQNAGRESEARVEAQRIEQQNRENAQWNYDQALVRYQIQLQRQENDRILEEQERMLLRVQPMRPLLLPRY
jgi:hypothetical protein